MISFTIPITIYIYVCSYHESCINYVFNGSLDLDKKKQKNKSIQQEKDNNKVVIFFGIGESESG